MSIESFKCDLAKLTDGEIINKYYHSGPAFALNDDQHHSLRECICKNFSVEYTEVFIVGSAKLGFSIKPTRRYGCFTDTSDIDIVILNKTLFEKIWQSVLQFEENGGYWPKIQEFKKYHFNGWIRPDKLPHEKSFELTKQWWSFFESLSGSGQYGPYKIRGGLYHSKYFLEKYQGKCLEQCRSQIQ